MESLFGWIQNLLNDASAQAQAWVADYGFHAVIPALLADPAGVPWAWIFLILFAEAAKLDVWWMLMYGFLVLSLFDHLMYWIGLRGGRPLIDKIGQRFPKWAVALEKSEQAMSCAEGARRGAWSIALGRYLPIVGRWVGAGAGLANVPFARFAFYDALGVGLTVIGFGLPTHLIGAQIMDEPWFPQAIAFTFIASTILTAFIIIWQAHRATQMRNG